MSSAASQRSSAPAVPPEQRARLSPTVVGNVYPALENLQRISHGHAPLPQPQQQHHRHHYHQHHSTGAGSGAGGAGSHPTPHGPHHHHHHHSSQLRRISPTTGSGSGGGNSSSARTTLPTYRQASVGGHAPAPAGDGSSSSPPHPLPSRVHHAEVQQQQQQPEATPTPSSLDSSLPDILHSHMVQPQIPPARQNRHRNRTAGSSRPGDSGGDGAGAARGARRSRHRSSHGGGGGERSAGGRQRERRRHRTQSSSSAQAQEGTCKEPCVKCVVTVTSFRWVLVVLSVLGVCCVVTGIVLAALHAAGNSFLFLAIMFIALGVLLVVVVGVGWKCTPRGHEPLHSLFGIGNFQSGQTRERRRRHRNRDSNWFGGVMYPEFQYRRPPPSYAASMQDYQNQAAHGEESTPGQSQPEGNDQSLPNSPPPSYRSRTSTMHSGIQSTFPGGSDSELPNSRPPTYRSRAPSRRPSLPRDEPVTSESNTSAPADISFTGPSSTDPIPSAAPPVVTSSAQPAASSSSSSSSAAYLSSSSSLPSSSSLSPRNPSSPPSTSVTMQVYTVPLVSGGSSNTDSQNSSVVPPTNTQNTVGSDRRAQSGSSAPIDASPSHQPFETAAALRLPSLHQRMESEDRVKLEQALQSLEEHMHESEGVTNYGATFEEGDMNTHL